MVEAVVAAAAPPPQLGFPPRSPLASPPPHLSSHPQRRRALGRPLEQRLPPFPPNNENISYQLIIKGILLQIKILLEL